MTATPSPNYSDKALLSADPTFIARVHESLVAAAISIKNEAANTAFHREREQLVVQIMTNQPSGLANLFALSVATDAGVIGDATVGGTVPLSTANVAAQAALVTDTHIDTAIASQFNSFIRTPGF